jgi:tetratricopeptide (TPR) repeat protein
MLRGLAAFLLASIALAAAPLAQDANQIANDRSRCRGVGRSLSMETRIASCTRLIESGKVEPALVLESYRNRASAYDNSNQIALAARDYDELVRLDPARAPSYVSRGFFHLRRVDATSSIADFDEALRLNPAYPQALYGRGFARQRLGDSAGSANDFAAARALEPDIDRQMSFLREW